LNRIEKALIVKGLPEISDGPQSHRFNRKARTENNFIENSD
jgi:hypothetical protein